MREPDRHGAQPGALRRDAERAAAARCTDRPPTALAAGAEASAQVANDVPQPQVRVAFGIEKLEPGAVQAGDVVERHALRGAAGSRGRRRSSRRPARTPCRPSPGFSLEGQVVLEARATAADHPDAQAEARGAVALHRRLAPSRRPFSVSVRMRPPSAARRAIRLRSLRGSAHALALRVSHTGEVFAPTCVTNTANRGRRPSQAAPIAQP